MSCFPPGPKLVSGVPFELYRATMKSPIPYAHPVFTDASVRAQGRHAEINGVNRTRFCGAYWRWGFHEDGVVSALRAIEGMPAASAAEERLAA